MKYFKGFTAVTLNHVILLTKQKYLRSGYKQSFIEMLAVNPCKPLGPLKLNGGGGAIFPLFQFKFLGEKIKVLVGGIIFYLKVVDTLPPPK